MQCPICGKPNIKSWAGLRKHLSGGKASGGHDLPLEQATAMAIEVAGGGEVSIPMEPAAVDQVLSALDRLSQESAADFLRLLLANLVSDKRLPKYQFERRFDCFLAPFLPAIVAHKLGGSAQLVVPEFPLKKAHSNQSTNADHLLLLSDEQDQPVSWVLVELKTDTASYDAVQADIYREASRDGWPRLRADLEQIKHASKAKDAYTNLTERVDKMGGRTPPTEVTVLYLTPGTKPPHGFHSVHFSELAPLDLGPNELVWRILATLVLPELI